MVKETVVVTYVGKFGPRVGDTWYNIDQKSGVKPEQFEKGKTYDVLVSVSKTGKKYIQQIVGDGITEVVVPHTTPVNVEALKDKPGDDKILQTLKKEKKETDWDGIARGKVACAAFGDALKSSGLAMYSTSKEEYLKLVEEMAKRQIEFTWKHQKGE